jgi:hypothetical protein
MLSFNLFGLIFYFTLSLTKNVSDFVMNGEQEQVRKTLKAINGPMYKKLKNLGQNMAQSEFYLQNKISPRSVERNGRKRERRYTFDDYSSVAKDNPFKVNDHLSQGVKCIKFITKSHDENSETSSTVSSIDINEENSTNPLITPLMMIDRGRKEVLQKRRNKKHKKSHKKSHNILKGLSTIDSSGKKIGEYGYSSKSRKDIPYRLSVPDVYSSRSINLEPNQTKNKVMCNKVAVNRSIASFNRNDSVSEISKDDYGTKTPEKYGGKTKSSRVSLPKRIHLPQKPPLPKIVKKNIKKLPMMGNMK